MVNIRKVDCPSDKINIKCPHAMTPTRIVIHNTANDASAENEIAYMHRNNDYTSFHFAVDDIEAVQGIDINRNSWNASDGTNGKGNREGISIEICYSKSGGAKWLKAVDNAAQLTAYLLDKYGWGVDRITKHADYCSKHCPHRILDEYGWNNFIALCKSYMKSSAPAETPKETAPNVIYAAYTNCWLPDVVNYNVVNADGYAGICGRSITGIRAKLTRGSIVYRVHTIGGAYLDWVKDHDARQGGYAGIYGRNIDGVQMYLEGLSGFAVEYRVSTLGGDYLPWVRNYDGTANGYAGIYGKPIDKIQIRIVRV